MTKVRYVRLYVDDDGESHFSDEEMELRPANFAPPAPPLNLSAFIPAKQMAVRWLVRRLASCTTPAVLLAAGWRSRDSG